MAVASIGYLGFSVSDISTWADYATSFLGLMPVDTDDQSLRFRLDHRAWRIALQPGDADDITYLGLEVDDSERLNELEVVLKKAGIDSARGSDDLKRQRGVRELLCCEDPEGLALELFVGATERYEVPFVSPAGVSGFLTGEEGLGHLVLSTADIQSMHDFYVKLLGFRLSDTITMQLGKGRSMTMEFFHCNPRHHSLALMPLPLPKRLHHFMIETLDFNDVGLALDRAIKQERKLSTSLGRHTNDQMVSFYARTPSGFDVEVGWGGIEVDMAHWQVGHHEAASIWGHQSGT